MVNVPVFTPGPYLATFKPPRMANSYKPAIGQETPSERIRLQRSRWLNLAVIVAGSALAMTTYSHRSKPLGALVFGAATSVVGVGITFFIMDLVD